MTIDWMIELLKIEKKCVLLFSGKFREDPENSDETPTRCTRDCAHCDLVQDDDELLEMYDAVIELLIDQEWRNARDEQPVKPGWYWVYAPTYKGGSSTHRENHEGFMFAKWSGKAWSIERCYYNRPGCVEYWKPLPFSPRKELDK